MTQFVIYLVHFYRVNITHFNQKELKKLRTTKVQDYKQYVFAYLFYQNTV